MEHINKTEFRTYIATNIAIVLAVFGLFAWNRAESRSDYRHHDAILQSIQSEMKDFHDLGTTNAMR